MIELVTDARPPKALVTVLNPINRVLLRSPIGRVISPFALLDFRGRHTGRRLRIPVLWHRVGVQGYVFSPAPWRANFADGLSATVTHHGRPRSMRGTLTTDPAIVADAINALLANGTTPSHIGLNIPPNHHVTASDVLNVHRQLIRFEPA